MFASAAIICVLLARVLFAGCGIQDIDGGADLALFGLGNDSQTRRLTWP